MDVVKISLEALLQRATNAQNENIDTAAVEAFCALINREKDGPFMGMKLLATRMHSKNEQEALQTLHILDYCMQKCGVAFQDEIGKFRFLNEMIKLVSPKYLGCHTPTSVKQKVLQLMYLWMLDYPKQTKIKDAYDMLKKQGVIKDVPLSVSADYTSLERHHNTVFQDEEKGKLLKKLLQSKNPEDLQAANRLIKTMVKEDEKKAELKSRRICELESVQNNIRLLNEMLDSYKLGVSSADETELIKELHVSCQRMRPNIVKLATQQSDEMLSEVLRVNDELGQVIDKYQMVIVLGQTSTEAMMKRDELALLDLSNHSNGTNKLMHINNNNNDGKRSNVEMLCDILTTPLLVDDAVGIADDPSSILKPILSPTTATEVVAPPAETDKVKKAFDDLDALGESLLMENLQSTTLSFHHKSHEKIPMNLLQANKQATNMTKSQSHDNKEQQLKKDLNQLDLSQFLVTNSNDKINNKHENGKEKKGTRNLSTSSDNDSTDADLLVDIALPASLSLSANQTPTQSLSRTVSSSSSTTSSTHVNAIETNHHDQCNVSVNNETQERKQFKLSDLFVDLSSIKPSRVEPIVALDEKHGITLTLHFGKDKPHEDVSVVVVTIANKNELPMKNILFRAIVPKCCKVKLQPASGADLPPYNPFMATGTITHVMLISNPDKVKVTLKFVVSYNIDDETMTEMGEIDTMPT